MRPSFAAKYPADGPAPDSKRIGYLLVRGSPTAAANLAHDVVGNLVPRVRLSPRPVPVLLHVGVVGGAGVPSQIVKAVIPGVPVVVASLATSRAWPDKRQENQTVDMMGRLDMAGESKHNNLPPILVVGAGAKCAPVTVSPLVLEARQDAPVCAGSVSRESGDVRVSNLLAIFGERGECVCNHTSDYTTGGPECEA